MRITQSMFLRSSIARMFQNRAKMMETQERIATQKKIIKPSDGPVPFSRAQRLHESYRQNEVFLKNIDDAQSWMDNTSSLLDQLTQYAADAQTAAQHGLDAVMDQKTRDALATQLEGILQESVSLANASYLGKNVFAGTETKMQQPFTQNGLDVEYHGNDQKIKRRISKQIVMDINVSGQEIVDTHFFEALGTTIEALRSGDEDQIRQSLEQLKDAGKNVRHLTTVYASKINNLQLIRDRLITANDNFRKFISQDEDAVLEEELVNLKSQQIAYQATLQSTSEIMNLSILKYM